MINVELYINDSRVDLFADESISINLSIKTQQNIDTVLTDFTQGFTIPASKRNNQIFEHWYNKGVTTTFNPSVKIPARIELNSLPFRTGVISINSATLKDGVIDYYQITFFGGLSNLAQLFGQDYINQLDLSAYDVSYGAYLLGLEGEYASGVVVPLISSNRNWAYSADTDADSIAYLSTSSTSIDLLELKPAIRLQRIIDAIATKYGITFNSNFFASADFGRLYMWASRSAGDLEPIYSKKLTAMTNGAYTSNDSPATDYYYDAAENWFDIDNTWDGVNAFFTIQYLPTEERGENALVRCIAYDELNSVVLDDFIIDPASPVYIESNYTIEVSTVTAKQMRLYFLSDVPTTADIQINGNSGAVEFEVLAEVAYSVGSFSFTDYTDTDPLTSETIYYNGNLPNQTVLEFLGGLVKMFNLVIEPVSTTEFNIEPLNDYYDAGGTLNLTKYIKSDSIEIKPVDLYGEINFNYAETDTVLGKEFRERNDIGYGDLRATITDANGEPLSKRVFNVDLPFVNLLGERLKQGVTTTFTRILVGKNFDVDLKPLLEKPIIFYKAGVIDLTTDSTPIGFKYDTLNTNPVSIDSYNLCFQFNTTDSSFTQSLNFGSEINPYTYTDGGASSPTLFKTYWEDYITNLYALSQRSYSFSGVLPDSILLSISLDQLVVIGFNSYRINSIQTNLKTGESTFNLINVTA